MSLHFLLKAEARTLSLVDVLGMSDDDAFTLFRRVRWGDGDEVVCPHCGLVHLSMAVKKRGILAQRTLYAA